jgi:hypothetical protein
MAPADRSRSWRVGARAVLAVAVLAALAAACNAIVGAKDPTLDDAGGGGGSDAAVDSSTDSALDAAIDAAIDGPPPVCTTGPCCTPEGQFKPATETCNTQTEFRCNGSSSCGAQPQQRTVTTSCSGTSALCNGAVVNGPFSNTGPSCTTDQLCTLQTGAVPSCNACTFGCNPSANACRPARIYLLGTNGGFQGGSGIGVSGRAGADQKCAAEFASRFPAKCTPSHAHAVLTVSGTDSIGGMAGTFQIPTTVQVLRADDDAIVTNTWNDYINPNIILTNPATPNTTTPANRLIWTGANGSETCTGWTVTTGTGVRGDTAQTSSLRLSNDSINCNLTSHLLCVCWTGP